MTFTSVTRAGAVGTSEMITVRTAAVPDVTCSTKGAQNHALHADQHNHYCIHKDILTHSRRPHAFREAHAERKQSESHGKFEEYTSFCYRKLY